MREGGSEVENQFTLYYFSVKFSSSVPDVFPLQKITFFQSCPGLSAYCSTHCIHFTLHSAWVSWLKYSFGDHLYAPYFRWFGVCIIFPAGLWCWKPWHKEALAIAATILQSCSHLVQQGSHSGAGCGCCPFLQSSKSIGLLCASTHQGAVTFYHCSGLDFEMIIDMHFAWEAFM